MSTAAAAAPTVVIAPASTALSMSVKPDSALATTTGIPIEASRQRIVVMQPRDLAVCREIAQQRMSRNADAGLKDARFARHRSSIDVDFQGVVGEMAFNRFCNLSDAAVLDTTPRTAATDDGFDARVGTRLQYTVDVKTTIYPNVPIRVVEWKKKHLPDIFVLQTIDFRDDRRCIVRDNVVESAHDAVVTMRGATTPARLIVDENLETRANSRTRFYAMPQRSLVELSQCVADLDAVAPAPAQHNLG